MSKLHLSVATIDDVDTLYLNEKVDAIEISTGSSTAFELDERQALNLYHFIRECLLLENKITVVVADDNGTLLHSIDNHDKN